MRGINLGLIFLSALILFGLGVSIFILPSENFSQKENRYLATIAPPSAKNIVSGRFSSSLSSFYRDRFPAKDSFINLKALCEIGLLKMENNNIIFAKDGYLIPKNEYENLDIYEKNINSLTEVCEMSAVLKKSCISAFAPRPIDVMRKKLPKLYAQKDFTVKEITGAKTVNLLPPLRAAAERGEYVWYRTDHHWTTHGAYLAYSELGALLGYAPYSKDFFEIECVTDEFFGSSYSSAGVLSAKPDSIDLYRYPSDGEYTVTVTESKDTENGLYRREYLSKKDKYSIFLGGNYAEISIRSKTENREKLLVFKDSYANSLVPFLALHYDLYLVDLRYFSGNTERIRELIASSDSVLMLHGVDTLVSTRLNI